MNEREAFDPDQFMREWGEWAKWSDARDMVQAAYDQGQTDARAVLAAAQPARNVADMRYAVALRRLIADDAYAITFQTFGQYRTALLKAIDAAMSSEGEQP